MEGRSNTQRGWKLRKPVGRHSLSLLLSCWFLMLDQTEHLKTLGWFLSLSFFFFFCFISSVFVKIFTVRNSWRTTEGKTTKNNNYNSLQFTAQPPNCMLGEKKKPRVQKSTCLWAELSCPTFYPAVSDVRGRGHFVGSNRPRPEIRSPNSQIKSLRCSVTCFYILLLEKKHSIEQNIP